MPKAVKKATKSNVERLYPHNVDKPLSKHLQKSRDEAKPERDKAQKAYAQRERKKSMKARKASS